jgi:hypothetical protein
VTSEVWKTRDHPEGRTGVYGEKSVASLAAPHPSSADRLCCPHLSLSHWISSSIGEKIPIELSLSLRISSSIGKNPNRESDSNPASPHSPVPFLQPPSASTSFSPPCRTGGTMELWKVDQQGERGERAHGGYTKVPEGMTHSPLPTPIPVPCSRSNFGFWHQNLVLYLNKDSVLYSQKKRFSSAPVYFLFHFWTYNLHWTKQKCFSSEPEQRFSQLKEITKKWSLSVNFLPSHRFSTYNLH